MDKKLLEKYNKLLPLGRSISFTEAEKRAADFLEAMAKVTDWRHILGEEKIKALSVQTATYAAELSKGTAKTITENKVTAEASEEYTKAREELERIDNDLAYLKAHFEIYNNAHIFYRNQAKGENV